mmetsp:Transcript_25290/g.32190  ORF Transcript_25290/g.32190 Transcript_25290/m.32190 type:complete len:764 (+) Transcript_25290:26-2317(+)
MANFFPLPHRRQANNVRTKVQILDSPQKSPWSKPIEATVPVPGTALVSNETQPQSMTQAQTYAAKFTTLQEDPLAEAAASILEKFSTTQCDDASAAEAQINSVLDWNANLRPAFAICTDEDVPRIIVLWGLSKLPTHPWHTLPYQGKIVAFSRDVRHKADVPPVVAVDSTWFAASQTDAALLPTTQTNSRAMFVPNLLLPALLPKRLTPREALAILPSLAQDHGISDICKPLLAWLRLMVDGTHDLQLPPPAPLDLEPSQMDHLEAQLQLLLPQRKTDHLDLTSITQLNTYLTQLLLPHRSPASNESREMSNNGQQESEEKKEIEEDGYTMVAPEGGYQEGEGKTEIEGGEPTTTPSSMVSTDPRPATTKEDLGRSCLRPSVKEKLVDVRSFVLLKHIYDDNDDNLTLVGTLIQNVFNVNDLKLSDDECFYFEHRFNDLIADKDYGLKERNSETANNTTKTTFQMCAPLDKDADFDIFPFKVYTATLLIELSTCTRGGTRFRPNMLLASTDKRNCISVQPPYLKAWGDSDKEKVDLLKTKMDKMKDFDFVTPFPKVEYIIEPGKQYCSKCRLTFYLVEGGDSKLVEILAPMLLISILNTLNVFNNEAFDTLNVEYIANSATFALTAVFILPNIFTKSNRPALFTSNNGYILLLFVGLALSSFPTEMFNTRAIGITGVAIFWLSFVIPIVHWFRYCLFKESVSRNVKDFVKDSEYESFYPFKQNYTDYFKSACEIVENKGELPETTYEIEEMTKSKIIKYQGGK